MQFVLFLVGRICNPSSPRGRFAKPSYKEEQGFLVSLYSKGTFMERTITLLCACLLLLIPSVIHARQPGAEKKRRPIKIDDLFRFKRVSDPQISPDG